ncbi:MAG: purine-nucleoside phosphorylase [Candidatus Marinimicrobia bacterium TMED108]|nr:MAG: purine-nucleoside phosphorylase [Candidatus Marinimicrobia bacterium TMED108]
MINTDLMLEKIVDETNFDGKIAIILGSGLSIISDKIEKSTTIPYSSIPNYPKTTIEGHSGEFVSGELNGVNIIVAKGRMHYYEGYSFDQVTIPVRLLSKLGIKYLIITNSAGSLQIDNPPGHFMIADSHMDFTFRHNSDNPRVNSHSIFHDSKLIEVAKSASENLSINTCFGCYCWTLGPSYETPAEIQDMQRLGGSAVGMSTVPEIITAAKLGIKTLTISCLTNYASGISTTPLTHNEVVSNANKFDKDFSVLLEEIVVKVSELN